MYNQPDSGKVMRPPSPGTLPVRSRTSWKNVGLWNVVVNDSHFDSSICSEKLAGRPNCGLPAAIFSQRAQEPPSDLPFRTGAESMDPRLEPSTIDPRVTMTKSFAFTLISSLR